MRMVSSLFQVLEWLNAPTAGSLQLNCAGWVLCCEGRLVTDCALSLQRATATGGPRSATLTLSCTAPRATAATAPLALATQMGPTASAAGTASTAWPATRPACPAAATQSVSSAANMAACKHPCTKPTSSFGHAAHCKLRGKEGGLFGFLFFFFPLHVGNVYWVVFWFKLSLDLNGVTVAGADGSPLQHLLLQMYSEIDFFFSTVCVLPWMLPVLKDSFKFLITKMM